MAAGDRTARLVAQVRSRIGEITAQGIPNSDILAYLNEAQADLCWQLNDAALAVLSEQYAGALTIDEAGYALPTDFLRERLVVYKTKVATRVRVSDLADLTLNTYRVPTEANPSYYLWDGCQLWLRAGLKTSGLYNLYYQRSPVAMSATVDPELPEEHNDLLVTFAVSRCREATGDFGESERLWAQYLTSASTINSRHYHGTPFDGVPGDRR